MISRYREDRLIREQQQLEEAIKQSKNRIEISKRKEASRRTVLDKIVQLKKLEQQKQNNATVETSREPTANIIVNANYN